MADADGQVVIQIIGDDAEFQASLGGLESIASTAVKGITTAVTAASTAIVGLGTAAAVVGSEFETSLMGTSTMFGDVEVDMDGLTDQILDLSSATGLAASDISSSLYNALSAGIPVTEDMTGAMEYMESCTQLAAAGFTDIDTAVTATAKVMNAYGMELDEVDKIQTIMLQTQNKGITTVDELGASLANVTPTASAMGVSFENVGAALATMTAQGTGTAEATTQLNSLIAELGKSGTTAALNLEAAAEGTQYAGMSFTDMMDAGVPLNEALDLMSVYADESGLSMIDLFSSLEAGKAALAMAGDNSATFADNLAAMSTEADVVSAAYDKVTDTAAHQLDVLKAGVTNLGIAVYNDMGTQLSSVMGMASGWIDDLTTAFGEGGLEGAVGALGTIVAEAIVYLAEQVPAIMDAAFLLISAFVQGIWDNREAIVSAGAEIIVAIVEGIGDLSPVFQPVVDAIIWMIDNFNALLPVIAGVTGAVVAFQAAMAISSLITSVTKAVTLFCTANEATTIAQAALNAVMNVNPFVRVATLVAALVTLYHTNDEFREKVDAVWAAVTTAISNGVSAMIEFFTVTVPGAVETLLEWFTGLPDAFSTIGSNIVEGLWNGISAMGGWLYSKVQNFISDMVSTVTEFLGIASPSKVFAEIGGFTMAGLAEGIEDGTGDAEQAALDAAKSLEDAMDPSQLGADFEKLSRQMQATVELQVGQVAIEAANAAEERSTSNGNTNTVTKTTNTVEKVAQIEGDGITGELVRMLGLRLKQEDDRTGLSFA